jgi:hypothetical protein
MFEDIEKNIITAFYPKKNFAIEQHDGVYHSVSLTTKHSAVRKTIQIFFHI